MSNDSKNKNSIFTDVSSKNPNEGMKIGDFSMDNIDHILKDYQEISPEKNISDSKQDIPLSIKKNEGSKNERCNITSTNKKDEPSKSAKKEKKHGSKGKTIVSTITAFAMMVVGAGCYYLSKKTMDGQLVTNLVNPELGVVEETTEWPWSKQQAFEEMISVEQTADEMKVELDKDETLAEAIVELEKYLYITKQIMDLRDFETVIKTAEVKGMEISSGIEYNLTSLIEIYNKHKNVDVTDYSLEALEKTEAINKIATIYRFCENYFKSGEATDCLSSAIYLACSSFCGDQLGLTPEEKAKHTVEVVEATEENKSDKTYMLYGKQKVELAGTIVNQINNIETLDDTILSQGEDYTLTEQDLDTMYDALNTAKKIVFTYPGESCYEAKIKNGKKLVLRPNVTTIAKKTLETIK